jgi:hypothetical protein
LGIELAGIDWTDWNAVQGALLAQLEGLAEALDEAGNPAGEPVIVHHLAVRRPGAFKRIGVEDPLAYTKYLANPFDYARQFSLPSVPGVDPSPGGDPLLDPPPVVVEEEGPSTPVLVAGGAAVAAIAYALFFR